MKKFKRGDLVTDHNNDYMVVLGYHKSCDDIVLLRSAFGGIFDLNQNDVVGISSDGIVANFSKLFGSQQLPKGYVQG